MSSLSEVRFQFHGEGVDWQELVALFKRANLGGREGDKVRRAFERSSLVCFAMDGSRLVAAGRALSDFEYHATIYDVAVDPDYQHGGIGSQLMRELLSRLPVWRVLLVADADVRPFYQRLGFTSYDDVMAVIDRDRLFDRE
jgi:ribosomal protein S18 acetylase RimI-like enzyme